MKEYMTIAEAAKEVGRKDKTIHKKIERGTLSAYEFDTIRQEFVPHEKGGRKPLILYVKLPEVRESTGRPPGRPPKKRD